MGWGAPSPLCLFYPRIFSGKKNRDYKKIESLGLFQLIMNPTVYKHKLKREEEEVKERKKKAKVDKIDEILEKVQKELKFSKDPSLDKFAKQLQQREQDKFVAQLVREELVRVQSPPSIYPQLTCEWFIEGLDFAGPG